MPAIAESTRAPLSERGADLYSTCYAALACLLAAEDRLLPRQLYEPCCGPGAIVLPLRARGFKVSASDLYDWRCPESAYGQDYDVLTMNHAIPGSYGAKGVVTNQPYKIAFEAANAILRMSPYVALLMRLNFLESDERHGWFSANGLARLHIITDRLPMMHRYGWEGAKIDKGRICYAWYVFDRRRVQRRKFWETTQIRWKDAIKVWPMMDGDVPLNVHQGAMPLFDDRLRASSTGIGREAPGTSA